MNAWPAVIVAALGALFDVSVFPLPQTECRCFIAQIEQDAPADLFILEPGMLHVYYGAAPERHVALPVDPELSVFDVFDLDGDGACEFIGIRGDDCLSYPLDSGAVSRDPVTLFQAPSQLSAPASLATAYVLGIEWEDAPALVLPADTALEVRNASGALLTSFPVGADVPHKVAYGQPFAAWPVDPPRLGPPDALEVRATRNFMMEPVLPERLAPSRTEMPLQRRGTPAQVRDAAAMDPAYWPWFPIRRGASGELRALYALEPPRFEVSLIRVRGAATTRPGQQAEYKVGPARRFPGVVLHNTNDLPDFDGDGNTDLALWRAQEPVPTVSALTRAAADGRWPVQILVHLFLPEKGRFAPAAASSIEFKAPVVWFFSPGNIAPLRHFVLRDFDGDGRTDVAYAPETSVYAVWRYSDSGFARAPDFEWRFDEPIDEVVFRGEIAPYTGESVLLRGARNAYLLRAGAAPAQ